jgi:hypothetical protein
MQPDKAKEEDKVVFTGVSLLGDVWGNAEEEDMKPAIHRQYPSVFLSVSQQKKTFSLANSV